MITLDIEGCEIRIRPPLKPGYSCRVECWTGQGAFYVYYYREGDIPKINLGLPGNLWSHFDEMLIERHASRIFRTAAALAARTLEDHLASDNSILRVGILRVVLDLTAGEMPAWVPSDLEASLVLADWLEEQGYPAIARRVRPSDLARQLLQEGKQ